MKRSLGDGGSQISRSVRPEMAAKTTEVHKHWSRTRVQKGEQRIQDKDGGSRGRVDWGAVQEYREGNDARKQQRGLHIPQALTKTQQHKSAVIENSSRNILMESTAVLNQLTDYCSGLYNYKLHLDTSLLQSNQRPPHKRLKACLCRGKRLKRLCAVWKQESLQVLTPFPLSCLRMEMRE